MARGTRLTILAPLALATALPLGACVHHHHHDSPEVVVVKERGGPPPHAPAHGYRRKHHVQHGSDVDVELVFDSGLGVYVVVGFPDVYFHANSFFRFADVGWQISVRPDGGWTVAAASSVPSGLQKSKGNAKNNGKKGGPPGPAKRR